MSLLSLATGHSRWGKWLDRPGLSGWLIASAALSGADFAVAASDLPWATVWTALETILVLPWLVYVLRLDRHDLQLRSRRRWPVGAMLVAHAVNVLLLGFCLYQKWACALDPDALGRADRYKLFTATAYVLVNVGLLGRGSRFGRLLFSLGEHPARLTAMSFGITGTFGALLLSLPGALRDPEQVSFVDGLFTAISAVCVTGLVVHNTAEAYSGFGQVVIFALMQIGGLGIMALYAAFAVFAGQRLRVRSSAVLAEVVDAGSLVHLKHTVRAIVIFTLAFELLGTALLYALFTGYPDTALGPEAGTPLSGAGDRLWAALFHAVSAFCNAGFSNFIAGAEPFAADWGVSFVLMMLIVCGGVGFPVLRELMAHARAHLSKQRPRRLSLHARTVLVTSAWLIGVTAALLWVLERGATLAGRPVHEQLLTVLFQSVTARTAGFNTLPIGAMSSAGLMLLCLLMFIGASPASTGGGIKTTTAAVLFANFRAELGGLGAPRLFDRQLGEGIVRRAGSLAFLSLIIVSAVLLVLLAIEPQAPLPLAFEVVSAFATVGLSAGVTGDLSTAGKLLITLTMFVGRIGPLTLALALSTHRSRRGPRLAHEDVTIG